jgi:hypothetical protein
MRRRLALPFHHPGKLRHEGSVERAFGEQRPEQIGKPLGDRKGLGHRPGADHIGDQLVADEAQHPADHGEPAHSGGRSEERHA